MRRRRTGTVANRPKNDVYMNYQLKPALAASILVLVAARGHAGIPMGPYVTLSGFGTLGEVYSDYRKADFTADFTQPTGAGYTRSWSPTPDSKLGVQVDVDLGHGLSGVAQVVSDYRLDGTYRPGFEWANVKYAFTPDWAVRGGRMLLPTYEWSEGVNVGYTLPWVRIPNEIRFLNTATYLDGIDALYRLHTGAVTHSLQVQWGRSADEYPAVSFRNKDVLVITDSLQYGDTSVHLAYQAMNWAITYVQNPRPGPTGRFQLTGAGFTYDPGKWFVTGDSNYVQFDSNGDFVAWYLSGGVRLGPFTPYVMFSTMSSLTSAPRSGFKSPGDGHTVTAGVRWDFVKNVDLKLQLQRVSIETLTFPDEFTNLQPGVRVGDKADVASLALDFVF